MLLGIDFCHSKRIMHRDLKPQNILINKKNILKIADFGLARAYGIPVKTYTHEVITLWYRAPEILLGQKQYSISVDIWSAACIFAEMINHKVLFHGESEIDQLYKIFQVIGTPNEITFPGSTKLPNFYQSFPIFTPSELSEIFIAFDPLGIDLLSKMLILDPNKRISAKAALKHVFLNSLIFVIVKNEKNSTENF